MDYRNVTMDSLRRKMNHKIPDESLIDYEEGIYTNLATTQLNSEDMDYDNLSSSKDLNSEQLKEFGRQVED